MIYLEELECYLKIIIIHEVSYLDKPVYEYQDFAERLAARGHEVTVIDFCENRQSELTCRKVSRTGQGEVQLISLPNNGVPIFKYLIAKFQFPRLLKRIIRDQGADAVLLYSVFINGTGAVAVCRELGIPVVYRALDAYHRLRKNRFQSWLLLQSEKYIYRNASILSVTNEQMGQYVREIGSDGKIAPVQVTDHGVDTDHFRSIEFDAGLAAKLSIDTNDFVCLFLGTTYSFSRLDTLVLHVNNLRKAIPNFKLLILGSGELDESIRLAAVDARVSDYVLQTGMISYKELPAYLSLAKIAICPFEINDITHDIIPIKILQYLAAELPVIATPLPDLYRKIPHEKSGVFYSATDEMESFVEMLVHIATSIDAAAIGARARRYVSDHHSMDRVIAELENLLEGKWSI